MCTIVHVIPHGPTTTHQHEDTFSLCARCTVLNSTHFLLSFSLDHHYPLHFCHGFSIGFHQPGHFNRFSIASCVFCAFFAASPEHSGDRCVLFRQGTTGWTMFRKFGWSRCFTGTSLSLSLSLSGQCKYDPVLLMKPKSITNRVRHNSLE